MRRTNDAAKADCGRMSVDLTETEMLMKGKGRETSLGLAETLHNLNQTRIEGKEGTEDGRMNRGQNGL